MKLRWSQRSRRDLLEIGAFIAEHSTANAGRWIEKLMARAGEAARAPRSGRVVPELARADVREVFFGNYRIVYRLLPREVHVVTVFEGHRRLRVDPEELGGAAKDVGGA